MFIGDKIIVKDVEGFNLFIAGQVAVNSVYMQLHVVIAIFNS